jgi:uncharacterized protein (DUF1330 family)
VTVTLLVQLWAVPGNEHTLVEYEDQVLRRLDAHGARLLQRVRTTDVHAGPYETHIIQFPSEAALDAYMADPARLALSVLRDAAIARTELMRVDVVVSDR